MGADRQGGGAAQRRRARRRGRSPSGLNLCLACREVTADTRGGLARAMADLAVALAADGHRVTLITDARAEPTPALAGVEIRRLAVPAAPSLADTPEQAAPETAPHNLLHAAAVYPEVCSRHDPRHGRPLDAVLAPMWRSEGAICVLDDRFPTIVSCMTSLQTLTEIDPRYHHLPDLGQRLALERAALSRSRYLHGLTRSVLGKTIDDYELHPIGRAVIPRGLRDRRTATTESRSPNERPNVLFIGRIERRKAVDVLFEAARRVLRDRIEADLTFAGETADPELQGTFDRQLRGQPELARAIRFTGYLSDDELTRHLEAADIVCVPSRYESHGIVLVEAMMFGKAIVTSDAGGILEVVTPDHDALVVPAGDAAALTGALRAALTRPALRATLAGTARRTYEQRYEVGAVARHMVGFVSEINRRRTRLRLPRRRSDVPRQLRGLLEEALALPPPRNARAATELLGWETPVHDRPGRPARISGAP